MEFIEHTISWCKGEMLEARIILILGLILLIGTFLFYKTGTTPFSKAIVLPLLLFSMLLIGSGFSMSSLNQKRIIESSYLYKSEKDQFINAEKKRVEEFKKWYPYTRIAMTIFILTGLLAYFFGGMIFQSIGLVFMLLGLSGFAIDHFSEERADIYYSEILKVSN